MLIFGSFYRIVIFTGMLTSLIFSQDSSNCYPPCRTGFICHNDECVSLCNPPCPPDQKCNQSGECIPVFKSNNHNSASRKDSNEDIKKRKNIQCNEIFIVRPELNSNVIPGDFEDPELLNLSNLVANTISSSLSSSSTIITKNDIDYIKHCNSKLIILRVKSYYKEPAKMGQYHGILTIFIETYNSTKQDKPDVIEELKAKGKRHWGDSVPLENAFQEVCKKIKLKYGKQAP